MKGKSDSLLKWLEMNSFMPTFIQWMLLSTISGNKELEVNELDKNLYPCEIHIPLGVEVNSKM